MTLFNREGKVATYLESLTRDNMGSSERPIAKMLRKYVLPVARKEFRTTPMPSGLTPIEKKFLERLEWPKGMYTYEAFKLAVSYYETVPDLPAPSNLLIESGFKHNWEPASVHKLDLTTERNRRSLAKGGGLPKMGRKRDNISEAKQYNDEKIKPNPTIELCQSILPGYRAQKPTKPGDEPAVRFVFGTPTHWWLLECEAFDDAIDKTVASSQRLDADIQTFYCETSDLKKWIVNRYSNVDEWISLDYTRFDTTITASMIKGVVRYFIPDYFLNNLVCEYIRRALIIMPETEISRDGGMPSGSKLTNIGEGKINAEIAVDVLERMGLLKYLVCMIVNGDDIVLGMSTKLTKPNLEKFALLSPFILNVDKCDQGDYVWTSSLYGNGDILTASVFKTLNNMMFTERQKSAVSGSKEYIELQLSQQCENIEEHPIGVKVIRAIADHTRTHLSEMSDDELRPAAELMSENDWKYHARSPEDIIHAARNSMYGEMRT